MRVVTRSLSSLCKCSGGFEANGVDEIVESVDDSLVELVKLREPFVLEFIVRRKGLQEPGGERGVDALEEFEKDEADGIAFRQEPIAPGVWKFFDQALGSEL